MEFKESKEKLKEMLAPRPKVVGGDKLVNYQGMDAYTETLMKTVNEKQDKEDNNLATHDKTVAGAINELKENDWRINQKQITDGDDLNFMIELGSYYSTSAFNKIKNNPCSTGAFTLTNTSITNTPKYCTQFIKDYKTSDVYIRNLDSDFVPAVWNSWEKLVSKRELGKYWTNENNPILKGGNGYTKLANGLIIQWGSGSGYIAQKEREQTITLPISFSSKYYQIVATGGGSDVSGNFEFIQTVNLVPLTNSKFLMKEHSYGNKLTTSRWIAIGY